jgi:hypothetical protein
MDIKHELGGDMRIVLHQPDIDQFKKHGICEQSFEADGVELKTSIVRDEFTTEPIAETDGHNVRVYLPEIGVRLPVDVKVCQMSSAASFYFGEAGKICLIGEVQI